MQNKTPTTYIATAELTRLQAIEAAARAHVAGLGEGTAAPELVTALAAQPSAPVTDPRPELRREVQRYQEQAGRALGKAVAFQTAAIDLASLVTNALRMWLDASGSPRTVRRQRKKAGRQILAALREAQLTRVMVPAFPDRDTAAPYRTELKVTQKAVDFLERHVANLYQASLGMPVEQKLCEDFMAETLAERTPRRAYPITVTGVAYTNDHVVGRGLFRRNKPGMWVSVRPCDEEHKGKTYLGIYLGDIATHPTAAWNRTTGVLEVGFGGYNPAIWCPAMGRIVWGAESYWGEIKSPEELREISDADISGLGYVQALKAFAHAAQPPAG